MNYVDEKRSVI